MKRINLSKHHYRMKPQDFTRFTQENDEKWLYKDITEKIISAAMEVQGEFRD